MPTPTAITRSAIIAQNFAEGGPQQAGTYTVTKRVELNGNVDVEDSTHMALVLGAFGRPLSPLRATMVKTEPMGMMRLRSVNAVPVIGSSNTVFDVTARYDQLYTWAKATGLDTLLLPVEIDFDATPRSVLMYRSPSFSTQPAADLNTTTDIGGTKVDYAGKPIQALIPQMTVRVSLVFEGTSASAAGSGNRRRCRPGQRPGRSCWRGPPWPPRRCPPARGGSISPRSPAGAAGARING